MIKKIISIALILITFLIICKSAIANEKESFFKVRVIEIIEEGEKTINQDIKHRFQKLKVRFLEGKQQGQIIELDYGGTFNLQKSQLVKKDDTLILLEQKTSDNQPQYIVTDKYRLGNIAFVFFLFFLAVVLVGGLKGVTSLLGMLFSLIIVISFIVPNILAGRNPLLISIIGSFIIMIISIYLAHGINIKTHLAIVSTFVSLILAGILSVIFVQMALLSGLGSEEAYSLTLGQIGEINFKGLLLGGIIIGTLGILDDVTITQTSSLFQLNEVNSKLKFEELFRRGIEIGREHVAATVNTLVLAYAGSSLALFLVFYISGKNLPFWMIVNSEVIAEEIIRALAGSTGLVLAVPITTLLTVYYLKRFKKD
jgi:uncharacterized membrane protein